MKNKGVAIIVIFMLAVSVFCGCGSSDDPGKNEGADCAGNVESSVRASEEETEESSEDKASETSEKKDAGSQDIVILYTNDVHCGVDNNIGYNGLYAYRKEMEAAGADVLLVDDGDEFQGDVLSSYLDSMGGKVSKEYADKAGQGRITISD